jgi:hypothetical protein
MWIENMKVMLANKASLADQLPPLPAWKPGAALVRSLFRLVTGGPFNTVIMSLIIANLIVMACTHYPTTTLWSSFFAGANIFFTIVFTLEATLKIVGLGYKQYFASYWCRFDFVLVIGAIASLAADAGSFGTLMRIFRIGRLLRLVRYFPGLNRLLRTLILCLPSLGNVAGLLFLVIFVFSIIGMNLFSGSRYGAMNVYNGVGLTSEANFDSFGIAYFTMFRCLTGENYNGIMREAMLISAPPFCIPDPGPNDPWSPADANCNSPTLAAIFWVLYYVVSSFMVTNILVAVVMEAFEAGSEAGAGGEGLYRLTPNAMDEYLALWNELDINGTQFLDQAGVIHVIANLAYPLGLRGDKRILKELPIKHPLPGMPVDEREEEKRLRLLEARVRFQARQTFKNLRLSAAADGRFHFHAVLHALMDRASGGSPLGIKTGDVALGGEVKTALLSLPMLQKLIAIQRRVRQLVRNKKLEADARASGVELSEDVKDALALASAKEKARKTRFLAEQASKAAAAAAAAAAAEAEAAAAAAAAAAKSPARR